MYRGMCRIELSKREKDERYYCTSSTSAGIHKDLTNSHQLPLISINHEFVALPIGHGHYSMMVNW
jgi:hypothetical protein